MRRDLSGRLSACRFFLRRPSEAPRPPPLSGSSAAVAFGGPQNSPKILTVKVIVPQRTGEFPIHSEARVSAWRLRRRHYSNDLVLPVSSVKAAPVSAYTHGLKCLA